MVVTRHQYRISTLVPQTAFHLETSGGNGEMAAVYLGYTIIENYMVGKPNKEKALRSFKEKLVRI